MFRFDYVPESELDPYKVIAEGEGEFKINSFKETTSKATGSPMIVLTMILKDSHGKTTFYDEYITPNSAFKIYAICKAINKSHLYAQSGELNPNYLIGEKGRCVIATDRPTNPAWKDKSIIAKYIDATPSDKTSAQPQTELVDDDLPF